MARASSGSLSLMREAGAVSTLPARSAALLRLNGHCPYYTMFPLSFPFGRLASATDSDWLIDPFCGRGTSNFAARLRGIPSVGIDSNPVAAAIAAAKLVDTTPGRIIAAARTILDDRPATDVPEGEFWTLAYHPHTLADICRIRSALLARCETDARIALRALMLGILHGPLTKRLPTYLSNQMPRTYATKPRSAVKFWRRRGMSPPTVNVLDAISRRARFSFAEVPAVTPGEVILGDSRTAPLGGRRRFRWCVTSPPYYGMRTYFPDQWLRNWFLGGPSDVSYNVDGQLPHEGEDAFVAGLAGVWKKVASACHADARLVIRFGALPSRTKDPRDLLARSLREAGAGWRVTTVKCAGTATRGKRQYEQFGGGAASEPVEEIDLYARLEG